MFTKHFFKTLAMFLGMIIFGLSMALIISYFDQGEIKGQENTGIPSQVAK